jgi:hypothetical protein
MRIIFGATPVELLHCPVEVGDSVGLDWANGHLIVTRNTVVIARVPDWTRMIQFEGRRRVLDLRPWLNGAP